jgi:hypothetical protein
MRSAGAPRPSAPPGSTAQVRGLPAGGSPALLVAREVSFLAETHFEEQQEQGSGQATRYQNDGEDFAGHARDQRRAGGACDDQRRGGPECEKAQPRTHGSTVHLHVPGQALAGTCADATNEMHIFVDSSCYPRRRCRIVSRCM